MSNGTHVPQTPDEKNWGMACHLAVFSGFYIPLGSILGPLVVWMIKREQYPFVNDQGKEAINFQLSVIFYCILAVLVAVAVGVAGGLLTRNEVFIGIGFGVFWLSIACLTIFDLVTVIVAAIAAGNGRPYRYPCTIRLVK